ncbi:hypothetical protein GCM10027168_17920 [Streptomyces capparidis]
MSPRKPDLIENRSGIDSENTVAFLYDHEKDAQSSALHQRLDDCQAFAAERGWVVLGRHADTGGNATTVTVRPSLDTLLDEARTTRKRGFRGPIVVLTSSRDCLSLTPAVALQFEQRIRREGFKVRFLSDYGAAPEQRADNPAGRRQ